MSEVITGISMLVFYFSILTCYLTALITMFEEGNAAMFALDLLFAPVGVIHGCLILLGVA